MSLEFPGHNLTDTDFVLGSKFGFQNANRIRHGMLSLASMKFEKALVQGGSRSDRHNSLGTSAVDHPNYWDAIIDWTRNGSGWTVIARCEGVTENAATTLTIRIRNVTDSQNHDATTVISSTSYAERLITIPVPAVLGVKRYRLQLIQSTATYGVNALGIIEAYSV